MEGVLGIRGRITKLRGQWRQGEGKGLEGRWLIRTGRNSGAGWTRSRSARKRPGVGEGSCPC
jgi:hypothetical protein